MWVAHSEKGKKIETGCWDWTCMYKMIADYQDELNISEEEAYLKFWEDVKDFDKDEYEACLNKRTLDEALSDGSLDELRAEFLDGQNIKCIEIKGE